MTDPHEQPLARDFALTSDFREWLEVLGLNLEDWAEWHNGLGATTWQGDDCGCIDDRCIGFHHPSSSDCTCVPWFVEQRTDCYGDAEDLSEAWRCARSLDMAAWEARREGAADLTGLVHHADHGSNYLPIVYTDRIGEVGAKPSTGAVGDSFDNALADAVNGLYKTELIRRRGPWRTIEQVELATLEYVWRNETSAIQLLRKAQLPVL